jgi:hypothetical protein
VDGFADSLAQVHRHVQVQANFLDMAEAEDRPEIVPATSL